MSNKKVVGLKESTPKKVKVWKVPKSHLAKITFHHLSASLVELQARFKNNLNIVFSKNKTLVIYADNTVNETILDSFIKIYAPNLKPRLVHLHNI